jgi:hypothetical protein
MTVEKGLVPEFVTAEAPRESIFRPDNLTTNREAGGFERVLKLPLP